MEQSKIIDTLEMYQFLLYFQKAHAPHIKGRQGVAFFMRSGSSCVGNQHFIIQNLLALL